MTNAQRIDYVTRDAILKLLSNDEIAKVSMAEAASGLAKGDEYLDLEHLDRGVLRAEPSIKVAMGHVVPRGAVSAESWSKILVQLAH